MAEYIERQKVIDITAETGALETQRRVQEIPAADVVPVVHAKWDDSLDGITPFCTACGCTHRCLIRTPLYCPNCGAKMDLED